MVGIIRPGFEERQGLPRRVPNPGARDLVVPMPARLAAWLRPGGARLLHKDEHDEREKAQERYEVDEQHEDEVFDDEAVDKR